MTHRVTDINSTERAPPVHQTQGFGAARKPTNATPKPRYGISPQLMPDCDAKRGSRK